MGGHAESPGGLQPGHVSWTVELQWARTGLARGAQAGRGQKCGLWLAADLWAIASVACVLMNSLSPH